MKEIIKVKKARLRWIPIYMVEKKRATKENCSLSNDCDKWRLVIDDIIIKSSKILVQVRF